MSSLPDASSGSLPSEVDFAKDPDASPDRMNRAMAYLMALIRAAGARVPELEAIAQDLQANGLTRIAEALGPVYADAVRIAAALAQLEEQYLGDGVVPAILAQAATAAGAQLRAYGELHDTEEARYRTAAAQAFAPAAHHHAIDDVDGLRTALDTRESTRVELFTTSGTWTKAAGLKAAIVIVIGAGGGGGGGGVYPANNRYFSGGGGGGGGGFSLALFSAAGLGATEQVIVGAGGVGGVGGQVGTGTGGTGGSGGATSFGTRLAATGGNGGSGGRDTNYAFGGTGGAGLEPGSNGGSSTGSTSQVGNNTPGAISLGRGAGGGGAGRGYSAGENPAQTAATPGGISLLSSLAGAVGAAGAQGAARLGCGSGAGGGGGAQAGDGFAGGLYGGGGGGGSVNGPTAADRGGAGGTGGPGACLIVNLF